MQAGTNNTSAGTGAQAGTNNDIFLHPITPPKVVTDASDKLRTKLQGTPTDTTSADSSRYTDDHTPIHDQLRSAQTNKGLPSLPPGLSALDLGEYGTIGAHVSSGSPLDQALQVQGEAGVQWVSPDKQFKVEVDAQRIELAAVGYRNALKITLDKIIKLGDKSEGAVYFEYDKSLKSGIEKILGGAVVNVNGKILIRVEGERLKMLSNEITSMGAQNFMEDMYAGGTEVDYRVDGSLLRTIGLMVAYAHTPNQKFNLSTYNTQDDEEIQTWVKQIFFPGSDHVTIEPKAELRLSKFIKLVVSVGGDFIRYSKNIGDDAAGNSVTGNDKNKFTLTGSGIFTWQPQGDHWRIK